MPSRWKSAACAALAVCTLASLTSAALAQRSAAGKSREWFQWRGPDRTGISQETGLLKSWPAEGPKLLWKAEGLGGGYSTPSFVGNRLYGMGYKGTDEVVWARNLADGSELWRVRINDINKGIGYPDGSRCTPTVDGNLVYALGVSGDLVCLEAATGKMRWQKNLVRDFGGAVPNWGYAESPLIDGEKLLVSPGGASATVVALNKADGSVIWKCATPDASAACYASILPADMGGKRQYVAYLAGGVYGVSTDGKLLWHYASPGNRIVCTTPVYKDQMVFATTAYDKGGGAVRLKPTATGVEATEAYFDREIQNHHGGVVLLGDHMYYFEGWKIGRLVCREFKTGKLVWADETKRKGSIVYAEGLLYCRNERGTMSIVEASPKGYKEISSFEQPFRSGKNAWAHPVVTGGKLYLRDQDVLLCYDIRDGK